MCVPPPHWYVVFCNITDKFETFRLGSEEKTHAISCYHFTVEIYLGAN